MSDGDGGDDVSGIRPHAVASTASGLVLSRSVLFLSCFLEAVHPWRLRMKSSPPDKRLEQKVYLIGELANGDHLPEDSECRDRSALGETDSAPLFKRQSINPAVAGDGAFLVLPFFRRANCWGMAMFRDNVTR